MCGICGTVGFADMGLLKNMCRVMSHRGPDDEGFFIDEEIGLGIRRLKVIDLDTGNQPIHNEDKTLWIVFNGEIYNFKEQRKWLIEKGHKFYTKTDTEVIIHLYEEKGEDCVSALNGMFTFAIWDNSKGKLFIARDRLGVKPLYYSLNNGDLLFASEMKSLLEYDRIQREINLEAIDYFLTFLYVPEPVSIFKGVNKLLPAHTLTYEKGNVSIKKYWDLSFAKQKKLKVGEYSESIYALLKDSVQQRLISDVPLGVFLSGGIDSSAIVGLMSKLNNQQVKTFSIGYSKKDSSFNELDSARLVAEYFNTEHHEFIVEPDLLEILPKLAWHLDEPFADSSAIPTYLVSQVARKHITVALSGIGGDECFAGYPRYLGMKFAQYYQKIPVFARKLAFNTIDKLSESTNSRDVIKWAKRFTRGGLKNAADRYIDWISYLRKEEREKIYSPGMFQYLAGSDSNHFHQGYLQSVEAADFLDKVFYLDAKTYLPGDLLFMGDKMSMANSLELREPFCDYRLLELSASIPYDLKIKGYNLKYLLKKALGSLLPKEILAKKKQGFMIPIGRWIKDELKDMVEDLLSENNIRKRGYFNPEYVRWMLCEHYEGRKNLDDQIWSLLMLEIWHQVYIDKKL